MTVPRPVAVLDASAGVKWFRAEPGSVQAWDLLQALADGRVEIVVSEHFLHEVLAVINREGGREAMLRAWSDLSATGIRRVQLSDALVNETARQCDLLECSFYDALAPALATLLEAPLYSGDRRAHASFRDVQLLE